MKPVISFYVVLVLFQSLIFGNMAGIELPANNTYAFQETFIHNNSYLDPFLVPQNAGLNHNLLNKNDFTPPLYPNKYLSGHLIQLVFAFDNSYSPTEKQIPSTPIIDLLGVLRI